MRITQSRLHLPASLTGTWPECQTRLFAAATGYAARSDHPEHIFRAVSINSPNIEKIIDAFAFRTKGMKASGEQMLAE